MRTIQTVYQVVYVMDDGTEFAWRLFKKLEHYQAFVESVTQADLRKLGIEAIRYRTRYVE